MMQMCVPSSTWRMCTKITSKCAFLATSLAQALAMSLW